MSLRGVIVYLDGEPVGLMGISHEGRSKLFTDYRPVLEPYLRSITVWRAVKAGLAIVAKSPVKVYAMAQHDEGARMLRRVGFKEESGYFVWRT